MRHLLIIKARSAKLACGHVIDAYFPMTSQALDPSGIGKIDVTLHPQDATCARCIAASAFEARVKPKSAEAVRNDTP